MKDGLILDIGLLLGVATLLQIVVQQQTRLQGGQAFAWVLVSFLSYVLYGLAIVSLLTWILVRV